jgi:S1-C subfamily serine protease
MVKLYGAGGFKGLPSYGTGILVSADGFILTANTTILNTEIIKVHTYDGRVFDAKVVYKEPELDSALLKIQEDKLRLPHFDVAAAAAKPLAQPGDWIVAFSNQFNIATRDEPMSVQRGNIAAYTELRGRRGIFEAPFAGEVYFVDVIACNPGAAGGVITNRRGELLGILGRELKNTLSDSWINYAIPIQAKVEMVRVKKDNKEVTEMVSIAQFVEEGRKGTYTNSVRARTKDKHAGFTGIVLVPNAVSQTPAYIDEILPGSPAAKAGLRPDDLIVYIDGELVPNIQMYRRMISSFPPGTELVLDVQRGRKLETVKLKIDPMPKGK